MPRPALALLPQKAQDILADMPPWYAEDEITVGIITAGALELQRIQTFMETIREQMHPQNADDTYGLLGLWENLFGLPVQPAGVSLTDRRSIVLAHLQKRASGAGADWEAAITQALNTNSWTYSEGPGDYQITVRFPYASGGYTSTQARVLIQEITSAHLQLIVGYSQGWLVGISLVGIDPL